MSREPCEGAVDIIVWIMLWRRSPQALPGGGGLGLRASSDTWHYTVLSHIPGDMRAGVVFINFGAGCGDTYLKSQHFGS